METVCNLSELTVLSHLFNSGSGIAHCYIDLLVTANNHDWVSSLYITYFLLVEDNYECRLTFYSITTWHHSHKIFTFCCNALCFEHYMKIYKVRFLECPWLSFDISLPHVSKSKKETCTKTSCLFTRYFIILQEKVGYWQLFIATSQCFSAATEYTAALDSRLTN